MRTRLFKYATVAAALVALLAFPAAGQVKDHTKIKYPPLPEFKIPTPEVYELGNGMKVFLMENHELPVIEAYMRVRTGSYYEPAERIGLASAVGQVMREGGTKSMSGDDMDDFLGDRAASIETSIGGEMGFASMDCLKEDFDEVFALFRDVLREPAFSEDKLDIAKNQTNSFIARRNDNILVITGREFSRLIYGKDSPLGRLTEYATVAAITRDDLVAWHQKYYHPNNMMLGVVGDFDSEEMKKKIEATFESWSKGPAFNEPEVAYQKEMKPGVYFIPKEDVTQANVRMGHLGITIKNPDYFAVQVMNEVLGGSFASRLFSNVRSEKGLAYSVFGSVGASFNRPGICQVGLQTKSETMAEAVRALREEVTGIIDNPPTAEEMKQAKDSILNSFVFNYASRGQVLQQQMTYAYYGMPADFLEQYRNKIEKVSREEVAQVAKKYVIPEKAVLLVVGKAEDFDEPVSSFGEVQEIDITIPPMPDTAPKLVKTAAALEAGAKLWSKTASALGGGKLDNVEAVSGSAKLAVNMGGQTFQMTQSWLMVFPDKARVTMNTPMGEQVIVLNGDRGFMMGMGQSRDMPAAQLEEQKKQFARDLTFLLRYHADPTMEAVAAGEETIEGTPCQIVALNYKGVESRLWVDSDGKVLKQSYQSKHPMTQAPGRFESMMSDYREVDGVLVPFKQVTTFDGQEFATTTLESFELNPEVDPSQFEKPDA